MLFFWETDLGMSGTASWSAWPDGGWTPGGQKQLISRIMNDPRGRRWKLGYIFAMTNQIKNRLLGGFW